MLASEFAELRAFVAVAERRNFSRAAADLGMVPSTISQTIKSLEERLGLRLLNRTTRSVSLTDAGERLLTRARPALSELAASMDDLEQFRTMPTGTLRLNVSSIAVHIALMPILKNFLDQHPGIVMDVTVDDEESDIIAGRFDAGIRVGYRVARDMEVLQLTAPSRLIAVASPAYLAQNKTPLSPKELSEHACICYRSNGRRMDWAFERGRSKLVISVNGPLICDSIALVEQAALEGIGIGYTIEAHVATHLAAGRLVALMRDWSPAIHSYYLYYSGRGQMPVPLSALIEFFKTANVVR